jgi:delta 1-pyrroline-5-carboxylate dehydrogenase
VHKHHGNNLKRFNPILQLEKKKVQEFLLAVIPNIFKGNHKMRVFQEEISGPVLPVTTFKDKEEAMEIANDTPYGLGVGVGHVILTMLIGLVVVFRLAVSGQIVITNILPTLRLVDTKSPVLAVKAT